MTYAGDRWMQDEADRRAEEAEYFERQERRRQEEAEQERAFYEHQMAVEEARYWFQRSLVEWVGGGVL